MDPVTQVYEFLDKENVREAMIPFRKTNKYRMSEIGNCPRRIKYRHVGYPGIEEAKQEATPGFVSLFGQDGDIAHDSVRWLMKKAGVELGGLRFNTDGTIDETVFIKKVVEHKGEKLLFVGRTDGYVKIDGEWHLLEIKSIDGWKASYLNKAYNKGEFIDYLLEGSSGKMAKFLDQCEASMRLKDYEGQKITKTCLVIKDRSMCQIGCHDTKNDIRESFILHRDDERWEVIKDRMAMIEKSKREGTELMRHTEGHWECQQCPFANHCWG
jgi:hypothetical protein